MYPLTVPCMRHPTNPLLHWTVRWSDRPHFATREHYERRLFSTLTQRAKVTPEQVRGRACV